MRRTNTDHAQAPQAAHPCPNGKDRRSDWSALADSALPDDVPGLREAKELHIRKAELTHAGAPAEEIRAIWSRLHELEERNREPFPLSEADYTDLRRRLRDQIMALYEGEVAAHAAIADAIS